MGNAKIIPAKNTLLLPYQSRWVRDKARLKLMEKARQIGMSWASAYSIVRGQALAVTTLDAWISSRDDVQAKLFVEDCKKFAGILDIAAEDFGKEVIDDKDTTSYVIGFANKTRIHSMSSNPDAQAGKRGRRLLDEFALHKNPRQLWAIAYPGITWGGQLEAISTHRGSANFMNELIREVREKGNPKAISLHRVTLEDALRDGFLFKLQSKLPADNPVQEMDEADYFTFIRSGCTDEESFLQEYMCVPADDASAFFEFDLIASCEYDASIARIDDCDAFDDLADCKELYVGVDVGRKHDLTVIWVTSFEGGRHLTRRVITLAKMPFSAQEEILWRLLELRNVRRCCLDATGLGMQLAERAQERFGTYKVEAVMFTAQVKSDLAYPLRSAMEDSNVRIPYDPKIRADLRGLKKIITAAGNVRFAADRGENGHSDRTWALALAVHARGDDDAFCGMSPAAVLKKEIIGGRRREVVENNVSRWRS